MGKLLKNVSKILLNNFRGGYHCSLAFTCVLDTKSLPNGFNDYGSLCALITSR